MKTCTDCGVEKPLEDFHPDKRISSGRIAKCRDCVNAQRAVHRAANLDLVRKRNREKARRWRKANPRAARQKASEDTRRFRTQNPNYTRDWYQRNIERERNRSRASMGRWRLAQDPVEMSERRRRYREANLETIRARERENTHRRRALIGTSSPELRDLMDLLLNDPCAYCGATDSITIDHVVPLSRGGRHEASNLAPACVSCNCSKGSRLLEEWQPPVEQAA